MIGLVLDASAMVEYARGSDAVGELLILAHEDAQSVCLPAVALAQAFADSEDAHHDMLRLPTAGRGVVVMPLAEGEVGQVGMLSRRTSVGTAHAVSTAVNSDAYLVTNQRKAVEALVDDRMIIEI
jgi:hypothetical protein